ncbi:MAG TPA: murein biosynthesis integral membrane protein MurJ [Blastocatellia bacterium]|nr:murein biosynthesis integral membrane protein MurJ [Blastocatellia bacterium]
MEDARKAGTFAGLPGWPASVLKRVVPALQVGDRDSWQEGSVNRRIFSAILTVGAMTIVVKLVSTAKEIVVAHQFGVGDGLDAFLIAFLLPSVAINVIAGSFNAALIPTYIQIREQQGSRAAQRLFSSVMICSGLLLVTVSVLMALAAPRALASLGSGFGPEKLELTRQLFYILLPTLPLSGLFVTWAAVLNAGGRFALAAISPMMTPLTAIIVVRELSGSWGVYSLAIAMVVGVILEGLVLGAALRKQGISVVPRWRGLDSATKQVMKQYAPMIVGGCLMSSTGLVDQAMAAMLSTGSVSILNYGNKVSSVVIGIGSVALSTAVLPQFSRMVAAEDWAAARNTVKTYTRLTMIATLPLTLVLVLASRQLVGLLFQHGAFNESNTIAVASVQSMYILQLPFFVTGMLFVRLISALKANHVLMWGTTISFTLNITLNYLFMKSLGASGIALSTSVVYLCAFCYLRCMAKRVLMKAECV